MLSVVGYVVWANLFPSCIPVLSAIPGNCEGILDFDCNCKSVIVKGKAIPVQALRVPGG
jgi:hypothetical protein